MRLKMAENSLFAILLRKPWWISMMIAVAVAAAAGVMLPRAYAVYGISGGFPFVVIGIIAAVRQWQAPPAAAIGRTRETVMAMNWREFADALETAWRREGYTVTRLTGAADFELEKEGRRTLACGKRWKAASAGIEPLRELQAAADRLGAHGCLYIGLGQVTDNARRFAGEHGIRLLGDGDLAVLLRGMVRSA